MPPSRKTRGEPAATVPFQAVLDACATPWGLEPWSALGEHPCLLFASDGAAGAPGALLKETAARLRALPCPVIAVGEPVPAALARGIDAQVDTPGAARPLLDNIRQCPLAAMTLVQLLRHNEDVAPRSALLAESFAYATLQGGPEFAAARAAGLSGPAAAGAEGAPLRVERRGDELHIHLSRPAARNAYNTAMRDALYEALQVLQADASLARAVIAGEGDCFSIGGDLNEFGRVGSGAAGHAIRSSRNVPALLLALAPRLEFRLHRACIGAGIELPAFAARVVARADTFIQLPELGFGLLPGAGGTVSLLRRIGRQRLAWLALSGRRINAATALDWGLVDEIA